MGWVAIEVECPECGREERVLRPASVVHEQSRWGAREPHVAICPKCADEQYPDDTVLP